MCRTTLIRQAAAVVRRLCHTHGRAYARAYAFNARRAIGAAELRASIR